MDGEVSIIGSVIGKPMTMTVLASGKIDWGQNSLGTQGSNGGFSHRSTGATPSIDMSNEAHFRRSCSLSFELINESSPSDA
jgi:hypothetical protein